MSKMQRTKGAVYEREIAKALSHAFGREFKRNIGQARDGGCDIDVGPLVCELKRRKSLKTIEGWMAQAQAAANRRGLCDDDTHMPTVICRADGGEDMIILKVSDFLTIAERFVRERL